MFATYKYRRFDFGKVAWFPTSKGRRINPVTLIINVYPKMQNLYDEDGRWVKAEPLDWGFMLHIGVEIRNASDTETVDYADFDDPRLEEIRLTERVFREAQALRDGLLCGWHTDFVDERVLTDDTKALLKMMLYGEGIVFSTWNNLDYKPGLFAKQDCTIPWLKEEDLDEKAG